MTVQSLKLRTLSPVHIGTGEEWRLGFNFVLYNNQTWIFDEDAVLQAKESRLRADSRGHYPLPGSLLSEDDMEDQALFRYVLRGQPPSEKADARLKPFIKDHKDRPYIPGSSLKGAFRTALAWTGWNEVRLPRLKRADIGRSRSWAGKPLEEKIFGRDPNHDLLRALQISDLHGVERAGDGLAVLKAQVLTRVAAQAPIGLEALVSEVEFHGSLKVDDNLFAPWAAKLGFGDRKHWLDELILRAQRHTRERMQQLAEWFENLEPTAPSAERIAAFYRKMLGAELSPRQAFLQIGWGAGWDGKTFWTHLQKDELLFEQIVSEFRLDKAGRRSRRESGDPFPTSRRVAVSGRSDAAKPAAPFGWVLVELTPQA